MKKGWMLGMAALAAVGMASGAHAAEVKMGGYYFFGAQNSDNTVTKAAANADDANYYVHRLQLQVDMNATQKSHAHMVTRVIDSGTVQGADQRVTNSSSVAAPGTVAAGQGDWEVRQLWMETEAWGIGVKAGNMPISLNDGILVNHDTLGFGGLMLSKSFGDTTVVAAHVKVLEEATGGVSANTAATMGASDDDTDLLVLSVLGKAGKVDYQLTGAYMNGSKDSDTANGLARVNASDNVHNEWVALTLGGNLAGVDLTGTAIYEGGWSNNARTTATNIQAEETGWLGALRAKGKLSFGEWNGYGFYSSSGFDAITPAEAGWSPTWAMDGSWAGNVDLLNLGFASNSMLAGGGRASMSENMWGVGAGVAIPAGAWTINPSLDYASVVDKDPGNTGAAKTNLDDAWGGSLLLTTEIDKGVTFNIFGSYVSPDWGSNHVANATLDDKNMHHIQANMKVAF